MFDWVTGLIESLGLPGIFFLTFLEKVFPPIPSEVIVPFGGYLASDGKMSLIGVIIAAGLGGTLGTMPLYWIGHVYGEKRIKSWVDKHGHWLALDTDDIDNAQKWFTKHRKASAFFCQLVPGVRSLIAIPAGLNRMPLWEFAALTFAGGTLWMIALALAGYWLGNAFKQVDKFLGPVTYVVIGGLILAYIWRAVKKQRAKTATSS